MSNLAYYNTLQLARHTYIDMHQRHIVAYTKKNCGHGYLYCKYRSTMHPPPPSFQETVPFLLTSKFVTYTHALYTMSCTFLLPILHLLSAPCSPSSYYPSTPYSPSSFFVLLPVLHLHTISIYIDSLFSVFVLLPVLHLLRTCTRVSACCSPSSSYTHIST